MWDLFDSLDPWSLTHSVYVYRNVVCPCSWVRCRFRSNGCFNGSDVRALLARMTLVQGRRLIAVRHSHHDFRRDAVDLATEMQF
jgi:hypothetical protein